MYQKELLDKWQSVSKYGNGYQLVDTSHPLEWYVGYSDVGKMTLLLISEIQRGKVYSSRSIEIAQRQRTDGRWTLSFDLLKSEQKDVFVYFCSDIIEFSRNASSCEDGLIKVMKRYKQWNLLMEKQKSALLNEASQKGLIGELLLMTYLKSKGFGIDIIISSWQEPEFSDQDFRFSNTWYEAKAIGFSSLSVTISSIEQLDSDIAGNLAVLRIDKCNADALSSVTLLDCVGQIKALIGDNPDTMLLFEHKLSEYGFIDTADYAIQHYALGGIQLYRISDDFPRILRNTLPVPVLNACYSLDIAAIEQWKV